MRSCYIPNAAIPMSGARVFDEAFGESLALHSLPILGAHFFVCVPRSKTATLS